MVDNKLNEITEYVPTISNKELDDWIDYAVKQNPNDIKAGFKDILDIIINGGFIKLEDWSDHMEAMNSIEP